MHGNAGLASSSASKESHPAIRKLDFSREASYTSPRLRRDSGGGAKSRLLQVKSHGVITDAVVRRFCARLKVCKFCRAVRWRSALWK